MDIVKGNMGWIEVIVGPMFSGKSEELIRRLKRAEIARQRVQIFKPVIDQRYAHTDIVSHSGFELPSEVVRNAAEILEVLALFDGVFAVLEDRDAEITRAAIAWAEREGRMGEVAPELLATLSLSDAEIDGLFARCQLGKGV